MAFPATEQVAQAALLAPPFCRPPAALACPAAAGISPCSSCKPHHTESMQACKEHPAKVSRLCRGVAGKTMSINAGHRVTCIGHAIMADSFPALTVVLPCHGITTLVLRRGTPLLEI